MIADNRLQSFHYYIDAVKSGEITVCRNVEAAVDRFVADIARQETKEFPYTFDEDAAEKAIAFFPGRLRHTIGRYAQLKFELEPWQAFGIGNIYGWKRVEDGTRRFRRVFWTMARKNGKSTLTAGMAIHGASFDKNPLTGEAEAVAQVLIAATKREQADMVTFAEVERMTKQLGPLCFAKWKHIHFPSNDGKITTVGSNKPFDGLNPSLILLDELHEWREVHRPFYDTMLTGGGSRTQPLMVCTTTAGDDQSFIWLNEYRYAARVAKAEVEDEKLFSFIFELDEDDDPLDESTSVKANPNIGVSVKADYLRDAAKVAGESILDMNRFRRYHCNLLVESHDSAFIMSEWDACRGELSDWHAAGTVGAGIDLGSRDDFASFALVARFGNEDEGYRYEVKQWSYIARDTGRNLKQAPFADWVHDGILHVSDTPLEDLRANLAEQCHKWRVESVAYDPAGGQFLAESLEREGFEINSMGQNTSKFHEPITDMLRNIREQNFRHNGDPLLRWAVGNAVVVRDRKDQWMFDKKRAREKIDPVVALVMGYRRAQAGEGKPDGIFFLS